MKRIVLQSLLALLPVASPVFAQQVIRDRIHQNIDNSRRAELRGNIHPLARAQFDRGGVQPAMELQRVTMFFQLTAGQAAELESLLQQQLDSKSPNYHAWLTPEQYGARFGISEADLKKVTDWLKSQRLQVVETARSRNWIAFSGTAAQISSAFHTRLRKYEVNGRLHYANANEPSVPSALSELVMGFRGLTDFQPSPRGVKSRPNFTSSISGSHFLAPDDFATIFNLKGLYNSGIDGTGQKIAVMGQTSIIMSDIDKFRSLSGLPAKQPQVVLVPGSADPGVVSGDIGEADLDIEWAGAAAPNATIVYVNSKNGVFDSLAHAIDNDLAPVISISYGTCEPNFSTADLNSLRALAQQANALGQTITTASGDSGAADCDYSTTGTITTATRGLAVDLPGSLPYVTSVGGTTLNEATGTFWSDTNNSSNGSALRYIPEVVWNDTALTNDLSSTGGGKSVKFGKPSWQTGTGVPNDNARDVPDVALPASPNHDGYLVCSQGSCVNGYRKADDTLTIYGGTSAGAPTFAGIVALINQKTGSRQGNINPVLYSLAASPGVFHDVTTGDNKVPCTSGTKDCPSGTTSIGYTAGSGYDLVTGLGSVDAAALTEAIAALNAPTPDFQITSAKTSLATTRGGAATSTLTITALNGFTGSIDLTCSVSSGLAGVTCVTDPASVTDSGSSTLTVTASQAAAAARPPLNAPGLPFWPQTLFAVLGTVLVGRGAGTLLSRRTRCMCLAVVAVLLLGITRACGGGSSSTPATQVSMPRTGTVTVQAKSVKKTHTTQISIVVN